MKDSSNIFLNQSGFSLAELIAALVISSMVMVSVLSIYHRAESAAASITRNIEGKSLANEVLQKIAEDLDKIAGADNYTRVTIARPGLDHLYPTAQLTILKTIYNAENKPETFEKIIWQSGYDYDSDANGLVLYRCHSGIDVEDKLLDDQKEDWEREVFIPICDGVTFFKIEVPDGEDFLGQWNKKSLPYGITVTISFAEPFKTISGELDVPDQEKITRTIAVNRTRMMKLKILTVDETKKAQKKKKVKTNERQIPL